MTSSRSLFYGGYQVPKIQKDHLFSWSATFLNSAGRYDPQNGKRRWSSHSVNFEKRRRIPHLQRESVAIVMLRRKGHSIQTIASFLGRSTSFVHRVVKFNRAVHSISRFLDLRKLPSSFKSSGAKIRAKIMVKLWAAWEAFILGETDRPP